MKYWKKKCKATWVKETNINKQQMARSIAFVRLFDFHAFIWISSYFFLWNSSYSIQVCRLFAIVDEGDKDDNDDDNDADDCCRMKCSLRWYCLNKSTKHKTIACWVASSFTVIVTLLYYCLTFLRLLSQNTCLYIHRIRNVGFSDAYLIDLRDHKIRWTPPRWIFVLLSYKNSTQDSKLD